MLRNLRNELTLDEAMKYTTQADRRIPELFRVATAIWMTT